MTERPLRVRAVLIDYIPHRRIGSELATWAVLQDLVRAGHDVEVRTPAIQTGQKVLAVSERFRIRPLGDETSYWSPDVVVTHPYQGKELLAAVHASRAPTVVMLHSAARHVRQALASWAHREASLLVPNAWTTARELFLLGDARTVVVRPPSPTVDGAVPLRRSPSELRRMPVVGFVNGSKPKGGHVIEQLIRVRGRMWGFLGAAGGYGEVPPIVAAVCEGPWPADDMAKFHYDRTDVHLLPSPAESWGMASLEALSRGVPVVTMDLPGVREALRDVSSRWAVYVPWGDVQAVDDALVAVFTQPSPTEAERIELARVLNAKSAAATGDRDRLVELIERIATERKQVRIRRSYSA